MTRWANTEIEKATATAAADDLRAPGALIISGDLGISLEGLLLICP